MACGTSSIRGDGVDVPDSLLVRDLHVHFFTRRGVYKALNGVNLSLRRGEVLGIAGESGSGKSTLGLTAMGLLPRNAAVPTGQVILDRTNLVNLQVDYAQRVGDEFRPKQNERLMKRVNKAMEPIRGLRLSMVFQEPMTSLNPVLRVDFQVAETVYVHNPALLARRTLARARATMEDMRAILTILRSQGGNENALRAYAEPRHLEGLVEQVLFVWRRKDIHSSRKETAILALCNQPIQPFEEKVLERIDRTGSIPFEFRVTPFFRKLVRRSLMKEGYRKAQELLTSIGIPHAERVVRMFPHELSGGMRQRVVIAIALANSPEIVIMDEPTSAVDVTVQAQILDLVREIRNAVSASFIVISHDLAVLAEVCDRIAIMYAGRIVEVAPTKAILSKPLHPYTQLLISAIPTLEGREIEGIQGDVPDMRAPPSGCAFHPRCPFAFERCPKEIPPDYAIAEGQTAACFLYAEGHAP
jgi:peptide/nickel transport system ATP-binding protein